MSVCAPTDAGICWCQSSIINLREHAGRRRCNWPGGVSVSVEIAVPESPVIQPPSLLVGFRQVESARTLSLLCPRALHVLVGPRFHLLDKPSGSCRKNLP